MKDFGQLNESSSNLSSNNNQQALVEESLYTLVDHVIINHSISTLTILDKAIYIGSVNKAFTIVPIDAQGKSLRDKIIHSPMQAMTSNSPEIHYHGDSMLAIVPMKMSIDKEYGFFTSSIDSKICYWRIDSTGTWINHKFPIEHIRKVSCLAYCELSTIDNNNCKLQQTCVRRDTNNIHILVSGSEDQTAIVWDVTNPIKPIFIRKLIKHTAEVIDIKIITSSMSSSSSTHYYQRPVIYTASRDKSIIGWDLIHGIIIHQFTHNMPISSIVVMSVVMNNKQSLGNMVIASCGNTVVVWNGLHNLRKYTKYVDSVTTMTSLKDMPLISSSIKDMNVSQRCTIMGTRKSSLCISIDRTTHTPLEIGKEITHQGQVNAVVIVTITQNDMENDQEKPTMVFEDTDYFFCGLSSGFLSIVNVNNVNNNNNNISNKEFILDINLSQIFCLSYLILPNINKNNTNEFIKYLLIGGIDRDSNKGILQVWNILDLLRKGLDTSLQYKPIITKEVNEIRSMIVHNNPIPFVITSGFQETVVWKWTQSIKKSDDSKNNDDKNNDDKNNDDKNNDDKNNDDEIIVDMICMKILLGLHSHYIMKIDIFDCNQPKRDYTTKELTWKFTKDSKIQTHKINIENSIIIVTGGCDGKIGLWPLTKQTLKDHKDSDTPSDDTIFVSMEHLDKTSVTALSMFSPRCGSSRDPLLISGSIDCFIYIWNMFTQEKLRVLINHHNRINALSTYFNHDNDPVLLSGSDDRTTIFWYDALDHNIYPPPRDSILHTFYCDIASPGNIDWKRMKALALLHPNTIFVELPQLFYLALIERQESFFDIFSEDLKQVIHLIPPYKRMQIRSEEANKNRTFIQKVYYGFFPLEESDGVSILEYAIHTKALFAIHIILDAWVYALNTPITDSLIQKVLPIHSAFDSNILFLLARSFPIEYFDFISKLQLVRAHKSVDGHHFAWSGHMPRGKRTVTIGSSTKKDIAASKSKLINECSLEEQDTVLPFLLPIEGFVSVDHFAALVKVSDVINNVKVFESEVIVEALNHHWNDIGWKLYLTNLFRYALTVIIFVIGIYSYQQCLPLVRNEEESNKFNSKLSIAYRSMVIFLILMIWYGCDEVFEFVYKVGKLAVNGTHVLGSFFIIWSHMFDFWNLIDSGIVISGIMGSVKALEVLDECDIHNHCNRDSKTATTANCLLAAAAVFLWFKVLYFLRPLQMSGEFGE